MRKIELRNTVFNAVPLKNVVGIGNSTAFQIHVSQGKVHATMGQFEDLAKLTALNETPSNARVAVFRPHKVLSRVLLRR
jgi:hypothetical protein